MRGLSSVIIFLVISISAFADSPPRDHITIDLNREWAPWLMDSPHVPSATNCSVDISGESPKFTCDQVGARGTFEYQFDLPIEMTQFPTLVLKYRAKNIDTNNSYTCIWIAEGEHRAYFPLIDFEKLTVDGKEHEIQVDLPKAPVDSTGKPFENGPVDGFLVSVMNQQPGDGSIELISAEFRSESDKPAPQVNDNPLNIHVTDDAGHDLKDAQVVVDAERKDVARRGTTDAQGLVKLTPIKNELDRHVVHVEATGQAALDIQVQPSDNGIVEVAMPKSMQLGGTIEDEKGKPLANAGILIELPDQARLPIVPIRRHVSALVRTNASGQWIAPPLPWSDRIQLRIGRANSTETTKLNEGQVSMDELRSGIATIQIGK